jgi:hypothetical protein
VIGLPEVLILVAIVAVLYLTLRGRDRRDDYVSEATLAHYRRQDLRRGRDREAHHCGPWQGSCVTDAARSLKWRER